VRCGGVNVSMERDVMGVAIGDTETLKTTGLDVVVIGETPKPSVVSGSVVVASE
jgi:hypothetical protein